MINYKYHGGIFNSIEPMFLGGGKKDMKHTNEILNGKTVLNTKGNIIGKIHVTIKDSDSGEIVSVLVIPSKELIHKNYSLTKNGEILFPFSSLSSVKDAFIIEEFVK